MKFGAIVLARMDSSRLPGKAMKKIGEKTLIEHCISRLKSISACQPILATSDRGIDRPLIEMAKKNGIDYFAGDIENVANRVRKCIDHFKLDYFARINGDSPFLNTQLLQNAFNELTDRKYDFVTNLLPRSFPYGISVEIFDTGVYKAAYDLFSGNKKYEEHITSYFYDNRANYRFKNIESGFGIPDDELLKIRLVIDTEDDYETIRKMYELDSTVFEADIQSVCTLYKKVNNKQK